MCNTWKRSWSSQVMIVANNWVRPDTILEDLRQTNKEKFLEKCVRAVRGLENLEDFELFHKDYSDISLLIKLDVRRMVEIDSPCPLGIGQELACGKKTFGCQKELISQNSQLFKVVLCLPFQDSFSQEQGRQTSPRSGGIYTSPDWRNDLAPSLCLCAFVLPRLSKVGRKAVGIHKDYTCLMVLPQPRSQSVV